MAMYQSHFHLRRNPFEVSPDPHFFLAMQEHREVLAGLAYGLMERKGFLVLTGEVGTGKSLLARCLFDVMDPRRVNFAYLFNSLLSPDQLLHFLAEDLGVPCRGATKSELLLNLTAHLIENRRKGRTTVAIFDEAQHFDMAALEEIRLLTNLETAQGKLLQVVLVGQPELDQKLEDPSLRQLKQRINLRFRLHALSASETGAYIRSRLLLAGHPKGDLFTPEAITLIHAYSDGIPRLINTLCDNSLLAAYAASCERVHGHLVEEVARELLLPPSVEFCQKTAVEKQTEGDSSLPLPCEVTHESDI
jgi:general secretion pathway protein A